MCSSDLLVSGTPQPILIGGQPATTPVFLNGSGVPLTPPVTHTNLVINTFHCRNEIDFNTVFPTWPSNVFANYSN